MDYPDDDLDTEEPNDLVKNLRGQLDAKSKEAKESAERAAAAEKQLAILGSGLDLDNPQHRFFAENYSGDMTPDAIKTKATELGFIEAPKPDVDDSEVAANQAISAAAAGAETPDVANGVGSSRYEQEMAEAAAKGKDAVLDVMKQYGSPFVEELI